MTEITEYKKRLILDVHQHGIEYLFKIINDRQLQKHYLCEDWKSPNMTESKVKRMHHYEPRNNLCKMCGKKGLV